MVIQRTFRRYEQAGWPGGIARPHAPYALDSGQIHIPSSGTDPAPGYAVYWNATENQFALPTSDAQQQLVCGILAYDGGTVGVTRTRTENSPLGVQYEDNDTVKVGVFGTYWGIAAEAMEYGDLVEWEWRATSPTITNGSFRWKKRTTTGFGTDSPELPAAGQTNGLPASYTAATVKTAIDWIIDSLRTQVTASVYRLPIAVASPGAVAAGELVELRVGYMVR